MKWTYEKTQNVIQPILWLYINGIITFDEKEKLEEPVWEMSGWTDNELIEECERRMTHKL